MATVESGATMQSPRGVKFGVLFFVLAPITALVWAIWGTWGHGVHTLDIVQLILWHLLTGLGVTAGFHRLFTHNSFETVWPVKVALAILGSMSVQGSLFMWCASHKKHHAHSDKEDDPHSPHTYGKGFWSVCRGFWHSHVGWLFFHDISSDEVKRKVKKLRSDPVLVWIDRFFPLWVFLSLSVPAVIGGLATGTLEGAFRGMLWGGIVRVFTVHHVTWSINSVCHLWGSRDFKSDDHSRNNQIFGLIGLGEGWHNGHHAFPTSAKHGLLDWQLDPTWWVIKILFWLGLAWNIKLPTCDQIKERRLSVASK